MNNAATPSAPRVNVGLIGAGFMGKAHSLAYAAMPMFFWPPPAVPHRRMLAELDPEVASEAAARFGFEQSTGDWRAFGSTLSGSPESSIKVEWYS